MAYNKINLYHRILEIQELTSNEKYNNGKTYKEIYWNIVYPKYKICYRTYSNYLGTPAKRELNKLTMPTITHNQLTLF